MVRLNTDTFWETEDHSAVRTVDLPDGKCRQDDKGLQRMLLTHLLWRWTKKSWKNAMICTRRRRGVKYLPKWPSVCGVDVDKSSWNLFSRKPMKRWSRFLLLLFLRSYHYCEWLGIKFTGSKKEDYNLATWKPFCREKFFYQLVRNSAIYFKIEVSILALSAIHFL